MFAADAGNVSMDCFRFLADQACTVSFSDIFASMPNSTSASLAGMRDTFPLTVVTIPFAIIFGTLAGAAGLTPEIAPVLSAIVFVGSAQFILTSLIAGRAALPAIWLTSFVVSLRHALYSATAQPVTKFWPLPWRALGGFRLTDETFAVFEERMQLAGAGTRLCHDRHLLHTCVNVYNPPYCSGPMKS